MQAAVPLACFLSLIRPPGVQYENALLQIAPVDKSKCPFIKDNNDIGFQLFTRHNPTVYQELVIGDDEKLFASNMDFHDSTVLYFHAFMEQPDDGSGIMVREAYMQRGDTNVIMIDAHHLEAGPWYFTAAQNTWYIGRFAAQFIDYLVSRGLNLNNTHLVGHSLGAQAAGVAGSALKSGRVSRITGLDPALPLFDNLPLEQRLDTSDADFVDVIHTDAGIFGYNVPLGHVDFYPNGGKSPQPGCELEVVIPQQLLLNKCNDRTETRGFYTFYLTAKQERHLKPRSIEAKLEKLFAYIRSTKSSKAVKNMKLRIQSNEKHEVTSTFDDAAPTASKDTKQITAKVKGDEPVPELNATKDSETIDQIKETIQPTSIQHKAEFVPKFINTKERQIFDQVKRPMRPTLNNEQKNITDIKEEIDHQRLKILKTVSLIKNNEELLRNMKNDLERFDNYKSEVLPLIKNEDTQGNLLLNNDGRDDSVKSLDSISNPDQKQLNGQRHLRLDNDVEEHRNIKKLDTATKHNYHQEIMVKNEELQTSIKASQIQRKFTHLLFNKEERDKTTETHVKRQKRFIPFLKRENDDNFLFRILDFLNKNRKNILPVFTVMREINTLVKSGNGELNHFSRERNNYIGATPPFLLPVTYYNLELGNESKAVAFVKRFLGMSPNGDRLTVSSG